MWYKIVALEERIVLDAAVGDAVVPDAESTTDSPDGDVSKPVLLDADPLLAATIPPLDAGDDVLTIPEGQTSIRFSASDLQANDPNAPADFSGIRLVDPNMGTLTELVPLQEYEFTVNPDFIGVPQATYDVFEAEIGMIFTYDVYFDVQEATNSPPIANPDMAATDYDTPIQIDVLANDTDPDGDPISLLGAEELSALGGTVAIDPVNNVIDYTPPPGVSGTDTFQYTIQDSEGNQAIGMVTIDLTEPVAIQDPILDLNGLDGPGDDFTITVDGQTFVPFVDSDALIFPDATDDPLLDHYEFIIEANLSSIPSEPLPEIQLFIPDLPAGVTIVGFDGEITGQNNVYELSKSESLYLASINIDSGFNPFAIENFIKTIEVNITSPQGLQDSLHYLSFIMDSRSSSGDLLGPIIISSVFIDYDLNSPPDAVDDLLTLDEDTTASINVLANDTDPDMDELTVSLVSGPANGMAALDAMGNLTYTPNANYNGPDQIVYEVSDGEFTDQATVAITVNPVNDAPVAADDALTVGAGLEGGGNVLDNDTDVDLPDDMLHAELVSGPMHGEVILNADGTYTYEHDASRNFADSFTYRVVDAEGASDEATVNITIVELSDAPQLNLPGLGQRLYIENGEAKLLSPAVFLKDPDSMDFDGGKLRVEISENGTLNDMLLIKENNKLWVDDAGQIYYRGEQIGMVEGGQNGDALLIEFNANASAWDVARVASRIAYQNDSDNPSTALRTVAYTVTDGDGGISNAAERTIRFFDVNDDPEILSDSDSASAQSGELIDIGEELGINITDADLDEDGRVLVSLKVKSGVLNFSDVDDLETAIFSDELGADGMRKITFSANLDEANLLLSRLTYQSKENFSGTDYLWLKVNDLGGDGLLGGTGSDWEKFEINVS